MRIIGSLTLVLFWLLVSCQVRAPEPITILDGSKVYVVPVSSRVPSDLFVRAGLILGPNDEALFNGTTVPLDQPLPDARRPVLEVRRAVSVTLSGPEGTRILQTTAATVGQALQDMGLTLYTQDLIEPPGDTPLSSSLTVKYLPSRQLTIQTATGSFEIRSAAPSTGGALADAGISMSGLDYSRPAETDPIPADGLISLVRVSESLILAQKPIPFESEFQASSDVPLDQQQVLHPGQAGLSVSRVRIRYEDGQETSRQTESETLVRPPQTRVVGYGTKVEVKSTNVGGVQIEYWRAVQMFATAYSPCRSAPDQCYSSTASGKPVKKGVVALRTDLYVGMRGQALYIPGYGYASVEDSCGGCTGKPWIDLGYSDNDYQQWGSWVTVYFLTPVPSNIYYVLD